MVSDSEAVKLGKRSLYCLHVGNRVRDRVRVRDMDSGLGLGWGLVLTVVVSDIGSGVSKVNVNLLSLDPLPPAKNLTRLCKYVKHAENQNNILVSLKLLFLVLKIHRSHAVKQQTLVMFLLMQ